MIIPLLIILGAFCYFDLRYRIIPNVAVLPLIVLGCLITGNWTWAGLMFLLMLFFYWQKVFGGGDVKLMIMLAALLGATSFTVLIFSLACLLVYRYFRKGPVPFAPFVLAGFLISLI